MNMSDSRYYSDIQGLRDNYTRALSGSRNSSLLAQRMADDLFALDLTVYSKSFSIQSLIYNSFSHSILDKNISLHPEQLRIISYIENNAATIISAPTSFGKTFCIFEYIAKHSPHNVVLVVPTLALVEEYFKKIIKKYKDFFCKYKVFTNINEDDVYDFSNYNIFILTHDRIVNDVAYSKLKIVDFLVIDEVYKLETDVQNDRVLILNMAYYYLAHIASKYTLLAPFIGGVLNSDKLEKNPVFFNSKYSPVANDVFIKDVLQEKDRFLTCKAIVDELDHTEKTLIYFPTVTGLYKYISDIITEEEIISNIPQNVSYFIEWAKEEIHEEWCVIIALEHGYVIHNGQIPLGTRTFQLELYENNDVYNKMLCTSTLLEGVNTSAKNIIITKPSRKSNQADDSFAAFDFFNLVGRTGRLYQHYVGNAYYIKSPTDLEYKREDAIKDIRFEITDVSKDIDIQKGDISKYPDVNAFLETLGITHAEYLENIGSKMRFDTIVHLYNCYKANEEKLKSELTQYLLNPKRGLRYLIEVLYNICENKLNKLQISLLTSLLYKTRPTIKDVVNNTKQFYPQDINTLIASAIKMKNGYIEHVFYIKVSLIRYFMTLGKCPKSMIDIIDKKILGTIEFLYFINSKHKKMLRDLGIYERDIDYVIGIIGSQYNDAFELKQLLIANEMKLTNISFLSKYVISNLK